MEMAPPLHLTFLVETKEVLSVGYDNTTNTDSVSVYNEIEEFY